MYVKMMDMSIVESETSMIESDDDILECSYKDTERSCFNYGSIDFINLVTPKKQPTINWKVCSPMNVDDSEGSPRKENGQPITNFDDKLKSSIESRDHPRKSVGNVFPSVDVIEISDDDSDFDEKLHGSNKESSNESDIDCIEMVTPSKESTINLCSEAEKLPLKERSINCNLDIRKSFNRSVNERHKEEIVLEEDGCIMEIDSPFKSQTIVSISCERKSDCSSNEISANCDESNKSFQGSSQESCSTSKQCKPPEDNHVSPSDLRLSFVSSLSDRTYGMKCDPVAIYFKVQFKRLKPVLARHLYYIFNELVFDNRLPKDLPLKWSNKLVAACGITTTKLEYDDKDSKLFCAYITLSRKIITTAERLRDTLIHEMCHAAVWLINKSTDSHGPVWKLWALKAKICFPELPEIARCHTYEINYRYVYKCSDCGYCIGRSRPSEKLLTRCTCGYCGGRFKLKQAQKPGNDKEDNKDSNNTNNTNSNK